MATTQTLPQQASSPTHAPDVALAVEKALVPTPHTSVEGGITLSLQLGRLPVELDVAVPVRKFRVRHLLALEPGELIETQWAHGADMPLSAGAVQLAWSEFEVIESDLAVRVTRLA
jgi:flagellar motor switch protein FliM